MSNTRSAWAGWAAMLAAALLGCEKPAPSLPPPPEPLPPTTRELVAGVGRAYPDLLAKLNAAAEDVLREHRAVNAASAGVPCVDYDTEVGPARLFVANAGGQWSMSVQMTYRLFAIEEQYRYNSHLPERLYLTGDSDVPLEAVVRFEVGRKRRRVQADPIVVEPDPPPGYRRPRADETYRGPAFPGVVTGTKADIRRNRKLLLPAPPPPQAMPSGLPPAVANVPARLVKELAEAPWQSAVETFDVTFRYRLRSGQWHVGSARPVP